MTAAFEKLVQTVNQASSFFHLAEDLQLFRAGFTDLAQRLEVLEKANKAKSAPPAPVKTT